MHFIEDWFGISPDGGSGTFEMSLLIAVLAVSIVLSFRRNLMRYLQGRWQRFASRKEKGRLHPDESAPEIRARIFSQAVGLFEGDEEAARRWLTGPQPALGGSTPWDYAATEIGAREVERLIGRLGHGIPS
jgi:putative toxin-antitoxin system antitoxin component (TIGR02293 family)